LRGQRVIRIMISPLDVTTRLNEAVKRNAAFS
jgi:hypothetical protein